MPAAAVLRALLLPGLEQHMSLDVPTGPTQVYFSCGLKVPYQKHAPKELSLDFHSERNQESSGFVLDSDFRKILNDN